MSIFDAMMNNDIPLLKKIIKDIGIEKHISETGSTPLHLVETAEQAKLLIEAGFNINEQDMHGQTPLFRAKTAEITKLLIEHGADVKIKTNKGTCTV